MTVYDPELYKTHVAKDGEIPRKFPSINKLVMDMDAAGLLNLVVSVDAPVDTTNLWLDISSPESGSGVVKAYDAGSWVPCTREMFGAHLGILSNADISVVDSRAELLTADVLSNVNAVRTAGYAEAGDGGHALYYRASVATDTQSGDGTYWAYVPEGGRHNILAYGAVGDGTTDSAAAIMAAIDAANASTTDRTVYCPPGVYIVGLAAVDTNTATYRVGALSIGYSNITLEGAGPGQTTIKCAAGGTYGALQVLDLPLRNGETSITNVVVRGITFDGNFSGAAYSGHPLILASGNGDCLYENLVCQHSSHYGLGLQNGGHVGVTIQDCLFYDCWRDGIDVKNNENTSGDSIGDQLKFHNLTFRNCCRGVDGSNPLAILDIMSPRVAISNIHIDDIPTDATATINAGIRVKLGLDGDSIGRGVGGQYCTISNVHITQDAGSVTVSNGIAVWAPYVSISNAKIVGAFTEGIQLAQSYCSVVNSTVSGAVTGINVRALVGATTDAYPFTGADDCQIIGNSLISCTTGLSNTRGRTLIGYNNFSSCTTGLAASASTSAGMRDFLNVFNGCTTDRNIDQSRSHQIVKGEYPVTIAASGATLTFLDDRGVYSNSGATALATFNLPSAVAGMEFSFVVVDTDGIRVQAAAGDLIRSERSTTATAGYIQSTDQWAYVTIRAVDTANWVMTNFHGAWSYDGTFSATTPEASLNPLTDDGGSLGDYTSKRWSDLALASGAVIYWNGTDVTLTHSANLLAFAGATSGYTFDVPIGLASGGTGANLTDPGADRILFWDDSHGTISWLEIGANLSITDTTISATGGGSSYTPGPQGRLSLSNGVAVADVTAHDTLYYVPYTGSLIPVYDGSALSMIDAGAGLSLIPTLAGNTVYDIFAYNNSGTPTLFRGPAWSSGTSRGTGAGTTELERVEGVWVNKHNLTAGPNAQRGTYLGTIRTDATPLMNDSVTQRHVWNAYNRVLRTLYLPITTDSWTYSTTTFRQVQGSTTYQVSMVRGVDEDAAGLTYKAHCNNSTATVRAVQIGIGVDSTTAFSGLSGNDNASNSNTAIPQCEYVGMPGLGYHYLALLERGAGVDTQTWYGDAGAPTTLQSGAIGFCMS